MGDWVGVRCPNPPRGVALHQYGYASLVRPPLLEEDLQKGNLLSQAAVKGSRVTSA